FVEDGRANGVGPLGYLRLLAWLEMLLLAAGMPRFPVAHTQRRVLARQVARQRKIGPHAQDHQVGVGLVEPRRRGVVARSTQLRDLFGSHAHFDPPSSGTHNQLLHYKFGGKFCERSPRAISLPNDGYPTFFAAFSSTVRHSFNSAV